jgi:peroxiredoxin
MFFRFLLPGILLALSLPVTRAAENKPEAAAPVVKDDKPAADKTTADKPAAEKPAAEKEAKEGAKAPAEKPADAASKPIEPGHSMHGEVFNEGPRQKAYLMPGMPAIHFPITTKNPLAQQFFNQGVGQLHGFWYFEAERSFRQVAMLDPECAMAYWGMAMANDNNEKRAKTFIEKAVAKKAGASPREMAWIDALAASLADQDTTDRRRKYVRALESLVQDDPQDAEAKAFLALQIWKNGSWMTDSKKQLPISSHQAVDSVLDQVFALDSMHPAHHYRIHLWDDEKPARALVSASLCGQTSPGIAHMWHMPGHTYSKLHRYADAAWQQEASARVDHAHMMRDGVLPDQIHNYAHNNEWLIRNLAFLGRVHDAIALAENMISLPRHPKYNTPDKRGSSAAFGLSRLGDVLEQYECWESIVGDRGKLLFAASKPDAEQRAKQARLLGLAQFGLGKQAEGEQQIAALESLLAEQRSERVKAADEADAKARADKKSDADVAKAMADALQAKSPQLKKTEQALAQLKAVAALAKGDVPAAKTELAKWKESGEGRKDSLARLFSLAGDHAEAEKLAREQAKDAPGQVYPLAVLIEVLHRADKKAEARAEFEKLRPLAAFADLEFRVFQRLAPLAKEYGWPDDWRGSREQAVDSGQRPDLATLGPFRWAPTPATQWTLPTAKGEQVSLQDFHGKPVVVIFYLGSGCLHCVEQIQKLAPETGNFQSAGISLVAISSEPLDTLQGSLAKLSPSEPVPFTLAADPQLEVFKAYRAHDDFENAPLHAVFLIDSSGLIRWQDISYDPFTDAKFLLEESKRLLGK